MLNLNKMELEPFLYIENSFLNFKLNLKRETFDHGTFLYKVHELWLITLHNVSIQHNPRVPFSVMLLIQRVQYY